MAEIHEPVTLTNAIDAGLARRRLLSTSRVRQATIDAIVDVEAVRSTLPQWVADALGLRVRDQWVTQHPDLASRWGLVTAPVVFQCQSRETLDEALIVGDTAVLGRTVLANLDLLPDHAACRLVPHPGRPNQPVSMVR